MVTDAKENLAAELRKAPDTPETSMPLEADYKQTVQIIRNLASEQYYSPHHAGLAVENYFSRDRVSTCLPLYIKNNR